MTWLRSHWLLTIGLVFMAGLVYLWWRGKQAQSMNYPTITNTTGAYPVAGNSTGGDPTAQQLSGLAIQLGNLMNQFNTQFFSTNPPPGTTPPSPPPGSVPGSPPFVVHHPLDWMDQNGVIHQVQ